MYPVFKKDCVYDLIMHLRKTRDGEDEKLIQDRFEEYDDMMKFIKDQSDYYRQKYLDHETDLIIYEIDINPIEYTTNKVDIEDFLDRHPGDYYIHEVKTGVYNNEELYKDFYVCYRTREKTLEIKHYHFCFHFYQGVFILYECDEWNSTLNMRDIQTIYVQRIIPNIFPNDIDEAKLWMDQKIEKIASIFAYENTTYDEIYDDGENDRL